MPNPLRITDHVLLTKGVPPASSYWVGATRDELHARIAARRPVQACGETTTGIAWDNSIAAEASIRARLAESKLRLARRRADAERLRGR